MEGNRRERRKKALQMFGLSLLVWLFFAWLTWGLLRMIGPENWWTELPLLALYLLFPLLVGIASLRRIFEILRASPERQGAETWEYQYQDDYYEEDY